MSDSFIELIHGKNIRALETVEGSQQVSKKIIAQASEKVAEKRIQEVSKEVPECGG